MDAIFTIGYGRGGVGYGVGRRHGRDAVDEDRCDEEDGCDDEDEEDDALHVTPCLHSAVGA